MSALPSPSRFNAVYFLNGKVTTPQAHAVRGLIELQFPDLKIFEPLVPGKDRLALQELLLPFIVPKSLLVGFEIDGLLACTLQEEFPVLGMSVMAVNSPEHEGVIGVNAYKHKDRVALYSSQYEPIQGRTNWQDLAETALDVPWLQHGVFSETGGNLSKYAVAYYIAAYLHSPDLSPAVASFSAQ